MTKINFRDDNSSKIKNRVYLEIDLEEPPPNLLCTVHKTIDCYYLNKLHESLNKSCD